MGRTCGYYSRSTLDKLVTLTFIIIVIIIIIIIIIETFVTRLLQLKTNTSARYII